MYEWKSYSSCIRLLAYMFGTWRWVSKARSNTLDPFQELCLIFLWIDAGLFREECWNKYSAQARRRVVCYAWNLYSGARKFRLQTAQVLKMPLISYPVVSHWIEICETFAMIKVKLFCAVWRWSSMVTFAWFHMLWDKRWTTPFEIQTCISADNFIYWTAPQPRHGRNVPCAHYQWERRGGASRSAHAWLRDKWRALAPWLPGPRCHAVWKRGARWSLGTTAVGDFPQSSQCERHPCNALIELIQIGNKSISVCQVVERNNTSRPNELVLQLPSPFLKLVAFSARLNSENLK